MRSQYLKIYNLSMKDENYDNILKTMFESLIDTRLRIKL